MLATFTGQVQSGYDATDAFGLGSVLDGANFTAQFKYDTSLGLHTLTPTYDSLVGGPFFGGTSPIFAASITLNGVTETFGTKQNGAGNVRDQDGWLQTFFYTDYFGGDGSYSTWNYLQLFVLDSPAPVLLTTSYTGVNHVMQAPPIESNVVYKSVWRGGVQERNFGAALVTTSVTLSPLAASVGSAAPEPGAWVIMIGGAFAVGALLRLKRRQASSTSGRDHGALSWSRSAP